MQVDLTRKELMILCMYVPKIKFFKVPEQYKHAFERRPFVNGDHWRVRNDFMNAATEQELLEFYQHFSPNTIKKI